MQEGGVRGHKVGPTTAAAPTFPSAEQCSARAAQQSRAPQQSSREAAGQCGIPAAAAHHNLGKEVCSTNNTLLGAHCANFQLPKKGARKGWAKEAGQKRRRSEIRSNR